MLVLVDLIDGNLSGMEPDMTNAESALSCDLLKTLSARPTTPRAPSNGPGGPSKPWRRCRILRSPEPALSLIGVMA